MKKNITTVVLLATLSLAYGQSNTFPTTGNVGIGTTSPSEKLEINGNVKATKFITSGGAVTNLVRGDGTLNTTYDANTLGNNIDFNLLNYDANNVIKTQPIHVLNYTGQTNAPENNYGQLLTFGSLNGLFPAQLAFMNTGNIFYRTKYSQGINPFNFSGASWKQIVNTSEGSANYMTKFVGGGSIGNSIIYDNGTNVGIGTTTPTSKLTVAGDIAYGEALSNTLYRDDAGAFGPNIRSGFYQTANPINFPTGASGWWHLLDVRHSTFVNNYALQIAGSFFDQSLWFRKTNDNANQPWRRILAEQNDGNVGIGTSSPQAKLHIDFGGEPKSILFREAESNAINSMISMMRFKWYDNTADFGMVRSDNYPIEALAVRFNEQETARFTPNGNVSVKNKLEAKEVKVTTTPTADFVFAEDYQLPKLETVEKHIKDKKHLPEIASAKEMEKEGVNVGDFQIKLLQKIEELTLYTIEQNKQNKLQEEQLKKQEEELNQLKTQNKELQELKKTVHELIQKNNQ